MLNIINELVSLGIKCFIRVVRYSIGYLYSNLPPTLIN